MKDYILYAKGVDSISVADAIIFPDSGKVVLNPNAIISTLENSTIIADNIGRYHKFTSATIDIFLRILIRDLDFIHLLMAKIICSKCF
ncbi:MAG: hypothetical protein CM15mP112_02100 [Flavobacteriales bacterium]|nr:MAG: hypothetical protein CM15mP112_02100 [Flavobacteriales bacterium]